MKIIKSFFIAFIFIIGFSQVKAQDASVSGAIHNVLDAYYGVKNALADDNGSAAQTKAKDLFAAINAVPVDQLNAGQRKIWMAYTDKLQFDSRHISESTDIAHQREHFTSLSKNMYELIKATKLNDAVVYEQYCPMKKATWLSETSTIKNPYLGKQMSDCGRTTATLNAYGK
jgi:hypothetical protein